MESKARSRKRTSPPSDLRLDFPRLREQAGGRERNGGVSHPAVPIAAVLQTSLPRDVEVLQGTGQREAPVQAPRHEDLRQRGQGVGIDVLKSQDGELESREGVPGDDVGSQEQGPKSLQVLGLESDVELLGGSAAGQGEPPSSLHRYPTDDALDGVHREDASGDPELDRRRVDIEVGEARGGQLHFTRQLGGSEIASLPTEIEEPGEDRAFRKCGQHFPNVEVTGFAQEAIGTSGAIVRRNDSRA